MSMMNELGGAGSLDSAFYAIGTLLIATGVFTLFNASNRISSSYYFTGDKELTIKDTLILSMLQNQDGSEGSYAGEGSPCFCITDPSKEDNPICFSSEGFTRLTGYKREDIEGRNCRFLQGPETDAKAVQRIRDAVTEKKEISVCLLNYKKDGSTFTNQFFLCPLFLEVDHSKVAYYIGVQCQVPKTSSPDKYVGENPGWRIFNWL